MLLYNTPVHYQAWLTKEVATVGTKAERSNVLKTVHAFDVVEVRATGYNTDTDLHG